MDKTPKDQMEDIITERQSEQGEPGEPKLNRRDFFTSLGVWSKIVIGGILLAGQSAFPKEAASFLMPPPEQPKPPAAPAPGQPTPSPTWINIKRRSGTPPYQPKCNWGEIWDHAGAAPPPGHKPACNWGEIWDHAGAAPPPGHKPACKWGDYWWHHASPDKKPTCSWGDYWDHAG